MSDLEDRVSAALRLIGDATDPCWLTFFLRLPSGGAEKLLRALRRCGLQPDEGHSARYAYWKLARPRRVGPLCRAIGEVGLACASNGAVMVAVDLDESGDETQSRVINLVAMP